jgi:hypothetical protein
LNEQHTFLLLEFEQFPGLAKLLRVHVENDAGRFQLITMRNGGILGRGNGGFHGEWFGFFYAPPLTADEK